MKSDLLSPTLDSIVDAMNASDSPGRVAVVTLVAAEEKPAVGMTVLEALTVSEVRYRRLFEAARDGILLLNVETGRITDANPFMVELLGYPLEELRGKELWEIGLFIDKESSQEGFDSLQREGYIRYEDLPLESKSGQKRDVEFVSNVYREGDSNVIQCNIRDITARKQMERAMAIQQAEVTQLNERLRLAMTESHHRVKNNLQVVTGMMDLGMMYEPGLAESAGLRRIVASVQAIAAVHDILTGHTKLGFEGDWTPTGAVFEELVRLMRESIASATIHAEIANIPLPTSQATSLALVLSELVHNAVKHGATVVWVAFTTNEGGARLCVSDNGPGFPKGFDAKRDGNTGLEMVLALSRWDLGGLPLFYNRPEGGAVVEVTIT